MGSPQLKPENLRDYDSWAGNSPAQILEAVKKAGGWSRVFPDKVPKFAHKLRNYFNETPKQLCRIGGAASEKILDALPRPGIFSHFALSGETVYKDAAGRRWFLMTASGTVYHVGDGKPDWKAKLGGLFASHSEMPFKLVSPDGTGGSSEVIILNPAQNETLGGKATGWFQVEKRINTRDETEGTYNYSETVVMGFDAHSLRDIKPHENFGGAYEQIQIYAPLAARRFPANPPQ